MKFLVVDDSATMRRIIINSLRRLGFTEFAEANDGVEALEQFRGGEFVVTEWNMPNMGGIDLVRTLRARQGGERIPILMVTTRSAREDIVQAARAGVDNYVVKPFTPEVLKQKIDGILAATAKP